MTLENKCVLSVEITVTMESAKSAYILLHSYDLWHIRTRVGISDYT